MGHHHSRQVKNAPSDWNSTDVKNWLTLAAKHQTNYYLAFHGSQFDEYTTNEYDLLCVKICYAIFGPPNEINDKITKIEQAYTNEQRNKAKELKKKIVDIHKESRLHSSNLCMSTIFVMCKQGKDEFQTPVFRVRIQKNITTDDSKYVDIAGRVYRSWDDWKHSNELPEMKYCYPESGYYTSRSGSYNFDANNSPVLKHGESPASSKHHKALQKADLGLGIVGFIAAALEIVSIFIPIAGPILAVAGAAGVGAALYGAGRAVDRLVDKKSHGESISDVESILDILSIITIPINFASSAANVGLHVGARTGKTFSQMVRLGVTVLKFTTVTLDSSMLLLSLVNMIQKGIEKKLTALDILQFSVSVFFFTHTIIQPITARKIIENGQKYHFNEYQKNLTDEEAHRAFEGLLKEHNENIAERSKLIKTLNKIDDPDSFFKNVGEEGADIKLVPHDENVVKINYGIEINPNRVNQLGPEKAKELFKVTKQFRNGEISNKEYGQFMTKIGREERLGFEARREETLTEIAQAFNTDVEGLKLIKINEKEMFKDIKGPEIDRLRVVFKDTARNYDKEIISVGKAIAEDLRVTKLEEFNSTVEMLAIELRGTTKAQKKNILNEMKNNTNNRRYDFVEAIKHDAAEANKVLEKAHFKFGNDITAAYHYRKHHAEFGNDITMAVYFDDIPTSLFKEEHLFKEVYSQDGSSTIRTYADANGPKFGVLIEAKNGKQRTATLFENREFFNNWTDRLASAKEHIVFVRDLHKNARSYSYSTLLRVYILKDIGRITNFRLRSRNGSNEGTNILYDINRDGYTRLQDIAEVIVSLHPDD